MNQLDQFFRDQWDFGVRGNKKPLTSEMITMPENKVCWIVGGGASIRGFDFTLLKNRFTIGVNHSYHHVKPDINLATDHQFYNRVNGTANWEAYAGLKVFIDIGNLPMDNIYYVKSVGNHGFPWLLKDGIFHGNNSGYGALNLAIVLGFKTIYLLGYDMQPIKGRFHYLDNWGFRGRYAEILADFVPGFNKLAKLIKERDIKIDIFNCSSNSLLKCFPFKEIPLWQ